MAAPVRLGVIGCGSMARAHPRTAAVHPAVQLHAYADVRAEAAQSFLHSFGGRYATTEPARLWRDEAIDAVLIATHHHSHAELAVQAAQAGKHVLVEKPLAMTVEDCRCVEEAVERAGIILVVGFRLRFAPLVQEAGRLVERPVLTAGQMMDNRWSDGHWAQDPEGLAQELDELVRGVQTGSPPVIGAVARDGTRAMAIALAIFESVRTGRPEPLAQV